MEFGTITMTPRQVLNPSHCPRGAPPICRFLHGVRNHHNDTSTSFEFITFPGDAGLHRETSIPGIW